jgi:hypothetical protein
MLLLGPRSIRQSPHTGGRVRHSCISVIAWSLMATPALLASSGCGSNGDTGGSKLNFGGDSGGGSHDGSLDGKGGSTDAQKLNSPDTSGHTQSDACAATSETAKVSPLDMYIVLDRSGSMADNDSWGEEVQALTQFFYDSNSNGLGVGLQYMPIQDLCNIGAYATPAVDISPLPGSSGPLITSLSNQIPFGGTPTTVALEGAMQFGKLRQMNNPDRTFVIVLSTDGVPDESCSFVGDAGLPNTTQNAISVIAAGAAANPPIKTFVIGVGNQPALNAFAKAGGTGSAVLVGAGDGGLTTNIEAPLIEAFSAIRKSALPCSYKIPPPEGGTINFSEVNVTFAPDASSSPQQFYNVASADKCTGSSNDWYYDNPTTPTQVELCPSACTEVKASDNGNINIEYGCATLGPPK